MLRPEFYFVLSYFYLNKPPYSKAFFVQSMGSTSISLITVGKVMIGLPLNPTFQQHEIITITQSISNTKTSQVHSVFQPF